MSKITVYSNWRVEVKPDVGYRSPDHKGMIEGCNDLMREIKRHVDYDAIKVAYDEEEQCAFCKYPWASAIDDDGKPGCCDKAIDEWETNHPDSQQFGAGA